jgi:hypothetical protein
MGKEPFYYSLYHGAYYFFPKEKQLISLRLTELQYVYYENMKLKRNYEIALVLSVPKKYSSRIRLVEFNFIKFD